MPNRIRKKIVVTVHGINSEGEWQDTLDPVLSPHFIHIPIKYDEYRFLGFIRQILGDRATIASLLFLLIGIAAWFISGSRHVLWVPILISIVCFIVSFWEAPGKREKLVAWFKGKLSEEVKGDHVHVIAHSFGTFLIGEALSRFSATRIDRLVLTGAVLPRHYIWSELLEGSTPRVNAVRNECGSSDRVMFFSGIAGKFIKGMGNAGGKKGFLDQEGLVHSCSNAYGICRPCNLLESQAVVHNVHTKFHHSDHYVAKDHAITYWLPFLWNFHCAEFSDFVERCVEGDRLAQILEGVMEKEGGTQQDLKVLYRDLTKKEEEFRGKAWGWWELSVEEYLRGIIERRLSRNKLNLDSLRKEELVEELIDRAVRALWHSVASAKDASLGKLTSAVNSKKDPKDIAEALWPHYAAMRSVNSVFDAVS